MLFLLILLQTQVPAPPILPVSGTNTSWLTVATPILILVGGILREYLSEMRSKRLAKATAVQALDLADSVKSRDDVKIEKLDQIHVLVNNRYSDVLKELAALRSKWANANPHDPVAQAQAIIAVEDSKARPIVSEAPDVKK